VSKSLKIAIIGFGKLGQSVQEQATLRGHTILQTYTSKNLDDLTVENLQLCDCIIECSTPNTAYQNLLLCAQSGIPTVSGTTGWLDHYDEISNAFSQSSFLYASNFSIGMNITFQVNKMLSRLTGLQNYTVDLVEEHHTDKLDSPSGTAITLAEGIIQNTEYKEWKLADKTTKTENRDILTIHAIRKTQVPGTHTVNYQSDQDVITLTHLANNRSGFGLGAVLALEYLIGKIGVYTMNDVIGLKPFGY